MTALLTDNLPLLAGAPNGIKKLRELILELAVRGKLVEQDASDEPASELLKRIAAEKTRLVAEGKIKKQKPLAAIAEEEMPFELPPGWEWCRLAGAGDWAIGSGFPTHEQGLTDRPILFCKVSDMNLPGNERFILTANNSIDQEIAKRIRANVHPEGTVIFPKIGGAIATNKRRVLIKPTAIDNNCLGISPAGLVTTNYLFLLLTAMDLTKYQVGTSVPALSQGVLGEIVIGLPPSLEQDRIVTKVDELMALCDSLEAQQADASSAHAQLVQALLGSLTQASDATEFAANWQRLAEHFDTLFSTESSIDALKQTLLQLAVRGKLLEQNADDESVSQLLISIEKEKTKLIERKTIRKGKPLPDIEQDEMQFKLPIGWEWIRLGQVGDWGAGATPARGNSSYYGGEMPWFKSGELVADFISDSEETVTELALKECSLRRNKPGDVLVAMYGATIGKTAILSVEGTTNQAVCACTPFTGVFNRYLLLTLKALKSNFIGQGAGGAQPNISREKIVATVTGLPPLAEQHRIVAKVDQLMALCDQLKTQLSQARQLNQQLASTLVEQAVA